jgi:hypothetical protein
MDPFPEPEKERRITIVPQTPEAPPSLLPNDRAALGLLPNDRAALGLLPNDSAALEQILTAAVFSGFQGQKPESSPSAES